MTTPDEASGYEFRNGWGPLDRPFPSHRRHVGEGAKLPCEPRPSEDPDPPASVPWNGDYDRL